MIPVITPVAAIVLYVAAALVDGQIVHRSFDTQDICTQAVSQARAEGYAVTDCVRVELGDLKK